METLMFVPLICRRPESISAWRSSVRSSCSHSSYVLRSTQGEPTRTSVFVPTFVIYCLREWNYFFLKVPYKSVIDYLFQFPVLCSEFFKLTTCLCEMYPAKISLLPDELFKNLMASLEVGLSKYPFPLILLRYCYSKIDEILILDWESYLLYFHSYFRNEKKSSASLVAQSIVRPLLEKKTKDRCHIVSKTVPRVASCTDVFMDRHAPFLRPGGKIVWQASGSCAEEAIPQATAGWDSPQINWPVLVFSLTNDVAMDQM